MLEHFLQKKFSSESAELAPLRAMAENLLLSAELPRQHSASRVARLHFIQHVLQTWQQENILEDRLTWLLNLIAADQMRAGDIGFLLSPGQQVATFLRYFTGESQPSLAHAMGTDQGAIKKSWERILGVLAHTFPEHREDLALTAGMRRYGDRLTGNLERREPQQALFSFFSTIMDQFRNREEFFEFVEILLQPFGGVEVKELEEGIGTISPAELVRAAYLVIVEGFTYRRVAEYLFPDALPEQYPDQKLSVCVRRLMAVLKIEFENVATGSLPDFDSRLRRFEAAWRERRNRLHILLQYLSLHETYIEEGLSFLADGGPFVGLNPLQAFVAGALAEGHREQDLVQEVPALKTCLKSNPGSDDDPYANLRRYCNSLLRLLGGEPASLAFSFLHRRMMFDCCFAEGCDGEDLGYLTNHLDLPEIEIEKRRQQINRTILQELLGVGPGSGSMFTSSYRLHLLEIFYSNKSKAGENVEALLAVDYEHGVLPPGLKHILQASGTMTSYQNLGERSGLAKGTIRTICQKCEEVVWRHIFPPELHVDLRLTNFQSPPVQREVYSRWASAGYPADGLTPSEEKAIATLEQIILARESEEYEPPPISEHEQRKNTYLACLAIYRMLSKNGTPRPTREASLKKQTDPISDRNKRTSLATRLELREILHSSTVPLESARRAKEKERLPVLYEMNFAKSPPVLQIGNRPIKLSPRELILLTLLFENNGQIQIQAANTVLFGEAPSHEKSCQRLSKLVSGLAVKLGHDARETITFFQLDRLNGEVGFNPRRVFPENGSWHLTRAHPTLTSVDDLKITAGCIILRNEDGRERQIEVTASERDLYDYIREHAAPHQEGWILEEKLAAFFYPGDNLALACRRIYSLYQNLAQKLEYGEGLNWPMIGYIQRERRIDAQGSRVFYRVITPELIQESHRTLVVFQKKEAKGDGTDTLLYYSHTLGAILDRSGSIAEPLTPREKSLFEDVLLGNQDIEGWLVAQNIKRNATWATRNKLDQKVHSVCGEHLITRGFGLRHCQTRNCCLLPNNEAILAECIQWITFYPDSIQLDSEGKNLRVDIDLNPDEISWLKELAQTGWSYPKKCDTVALLEKLDICGLGGFVYRTHPDHPWRLCRNYRELARQYKDTKHKPPSLGQCKVAPGLEKEHWPRVVQLNQTTMRSLVSILQAERQTKELPPDLHALNHFSREAMAIVEMLIAYNSGLIYDALRRLPVIYKPATPDLVNANRDDLTEAGKLGMIRGLVGFDCSYPVNLATYCYRWIEQFMRRECIKLLPWRTSVNFADVRLPEYQALVKKVLTELGRTPSVEEITLESLKRQLTYENWREIQTCLQEDRMDKLDKNLKKSWQSRLKMMQKIAEAAQRLNLISLDAPVKPGEDITPLQLINGKNVDPTKAAEHSDRRERLEELLDTLPPRQQKILRLYFGFEDGYSYTFEEIGKKFGLTRQRISQLYQRALLHIQNHLKQHPEQLEAYRELLLS